MGRLKNLWKETGKYIWQMTQPTKVTAPSFSLVLKKKAEKKERIPLNHHMSSSANKQISRLCCSPPAPAAHNPPLKPPFLSFSLVPSTLWFPCLFMTGRSNGKSTSDRWVHRWGIWRIVAVMTSESRFIVGRWVFPWHPGSSVMLPLARAGKSG